MQRLRVPIALLIAAAVAAPAQAGAGIAEPLAKRLAQALAVRKIAPRRTGAIAFDLEKDRAVFSVKPNLALVPASNQKLVVTYAVLRSLGADFTIETDVLGEGRLDGAVWRGSLVLQGHGDPTLTTSDLNALARQIRRSGIVRVTGSVAGDESFFDSRRVAPGWKWSYYIDESPPLSALSVDRGRFHGGISRVPALGAAMAFREALVRAGVRVTGGARAARATAAASELAGVDSPPLGAIVRFMDRESDNFTAELLLKQLGAADGAVGTTAAGAAAARDILAADGIPLAGVRVVDGSGLSALNRLTPRAIVALLRAAWQDSSLRASFVSALAVAGVNGTLDHRMRRGPARGNVFAKTGTTAVASALSGFVRRRYVFSVLQNGRPLCHWCARRAQDRFATVLAAQ